MNYLINNNRTFPSSSLIQLWTRTISAWQNALVFAVVSLRSYLRVSFNFDSQVDHYIYGNVLFTLATTCLLPVWTILYLTIFSQTEEKEKEKEE